MQSASSGELKTELDVTKTMLRQCRERAERMPRKYGKIIDDLVEEMKGHSQMTYGNLTRE